MKIRYLSIILALAVILSFSSCGKRRANNSHVSRDTDTSLSADILMTFRRLIQAQTAPLTRILHREMKAHPKVMSRHLKNIKALRLKYRNLLSLLPSASTKALKSEAKRMPPSQRKVIPAIHIARTAVSF